MTNEPARTPAVEQTVTEIDPDLKDLVSEWQFAQIRLARLQSDPALRYELMLVIGLLLLVFGGPAILWIRRWTLTGSLQPYALLVIPLTLVWIWLARLRLVVPEAEPIRKALRVERQTRMAPKKIGEREKTVLNILVEEPPIPDTRTSGLLIAALAVAVIAFWIRDPSLSCLSFILTCGGIVLYRHGKFAFRAALFPFVMLFAMIPLPGPVNDLVMDHVQPLALNVVEHIINNVGATAAVPLEGDPLQITAGGHSYSLYTERAGLCIQESLAIILCTIFYLSLIRTKSMLPKVGVIVTTMVVSGILVTGRLIALSWISAFDKDVASFMEGISRYILVLAGLALAYLLAKGFKCVKYHRWVSISLER